MDLIQYGIGQNLIEKIKEKLKDPQKAEAVKEIIFDITKEDLQNKTKLTRLVHRLSHLLECPISGDEAQGIIQFVVDQRIDPNNHWHLIKLWHKFR